MASREEFFWRRQEAGVAILGANGALKMTTVVLWARRARVEGKESRERGGGKNAIRLSGGDLCDGADQGPERVERISRAGYGSTPARGRPPGEKRPRADGASVHERGHMVSYHAEDRRWRAAAAGGREQDGVRKTLRGG